MLLDRGAAAERSGSVPPAVLSARERQVLTGLAQGKRTAAIAAALKLSEAAVTLYISNARRKLVARTREEAIAKAIVAGLIAI